MSEPIAEKPKPIGSVLTANRLDTGIVQYWAGESWSSQLSDAKLHDAVDVAAELDRIRASRAVVGIYSFEVLAKSDGLWILSARERFRADGANAVLKRLQLSEVT